MAGIYIHVPFCKQACFYCDFHFSTSTHDREKVMSAIARELELQRHYLDGERVDTIYFGGGTPSLLGPHVIENLLKLIFDTFDVISLPEITLEANPDDLSIERCEGLRDAGVNRLSIGVQSYDNTVLSFFNRAHTADQSLTSVQLVRNCGFSNINLDLIYGVPGQTAKQLEDDLATLISTRPEHISAYCLTIEPKTVFGNRKQRKLLTEMDEAAVAIQFDRVVDELTGAGYEHYEVSNFALPGYRSKHNTSYWLGEKYLGVGPSAHSFNGHSRQFNIANNAQYCRLIESDEPWFEKEILSTADQINERLMTGLRTSWGVDLIRLRDDLGFDLSAANGGRLQYLLDNEFALLESGKLKLTQKGLLVADKISSDFFV